MQMFKKIILAFKFSSACRSALEKAIQISILNDAELFIFHALDYRLIGRDQRDSDLFKLNQQMEQKFETEIKPLIDDFPNFKFGSSPSDPALEICKIARQIRADLILLGYYVNAVFKYRKIYLRDFSVTTATDPQRTKCPNSKGWQPERAVRYATA